MIGRRPIQASGFKRYYFGEGTGRDTLGEPEQEWLFLPF
jgi:hypothetical protein